MTKIEQHLGKLGFRCKDKVIGLEGVITSISFDLYGCIQAVVNPGLDNDGKPKDLLWFDLNRLEIISKEPVMKVPNFLEGIQANGEQGSCEKPKMTRL